MAQIAERGARSLEVPADSLLRRAARKCESCGGVAKKRSRLCRACLRKKYGATHKDGWCVISKAIFENQNQLGRDLSLGGLGLDVNEVTCSRRTKIAHVIISDLDSGAQLVHYWPSSGKWWKPKSKVTGFLESFEEAVELAKTMCAEMGLS